MSEPENFLQKFFQRWSRRKLAATPAGAARREAAAEADAQTKLHPDAASDAAPIFDPASLPPIESINAASDVRAFLAPGVPIELTRAALRRAWTTDPSICDFIGIAENQWDFTQSDGVPGFGPLNVAAELRRLVTELRSDAPAGVAPAPDASTAQTEQGPEKAVETESPASTAAAREIVAAAEIPAADADDVRRIGEDDVAMQDDDNAAVQDNSGGDARNQTPDRKHGRALPK